MTDPGQDFLPKLGEGLCFLWELESSFFLESLMDWRGNGKHKSQFHCRDLIRPDVFMCNPNIDSIMVIFKTGHRAQTIICRQEVGRRPGGDDGGRGEL